MSATTNIYLVRHGETAWNVEHRMQGHQDSSLTELGVQQALWLGERLRKELPHVIYTSSSNRAYRTAELIKQENDIAINTSDELKEINLGLWEGKTQAFIKENYSDQFENFWNDPESYIPYGGETFKQVEHRAISKLSEILSLHQGKRVLIVTHTVVVKLLMADFENRLLKDLWKPPFIHPVSLCHIHLANDLPSILLHGDTSHYKISLN
ncbi:histidine phosphatase family protein [Cohnella sp. JJ-181]|uniref:histidine phosphatase family protein n=1 Tax=Cohnella rhizoplanae TaxID=2974897 RepID=UPI0022FF8E7F|nr:histidine phosphatase family protein [Cohnella sp. JJ-181]CAI6087062.1 Phosphoserine phosphatase 1 [Cohnella sp. JJ-181]